MHPTWTKKRCATWTHIDLSPSVCAAIWPWSQFSSCFSGHKIKSPSIMFCITCILHDCRVGYRYFTWCSDPLGTTSWYDLAKWGRIFLLFQVVITVTTGQFAPPPPVQPCPSRLNPEDDDVDGGYCCEAPCDPAGGKGGRLSRATTYERTSLIISNDIPSSLPMIQHWTHKKKVQVIDKAQFSRQKGNSSVISYLGYPRWHMLRLCKPFKYWRLWDHDTQSCYDKTLASVLPKEMFYTESGVELWCVKRAELIRVYMTEGCRVQAIL